MEWCEYLSGSYFGILYLYLWYNHAILVSNDCVGDINPCGLFCDCVYCFQSHFSLSIGMVIRCFPVSSYMCATSFSDCMVHESAFISFSGLHSFIEMCASGMIKVENKYLLALPKVEISCLSNLQNICLCILNFPSSIL